jgi:hypothetical protein
MMDKSADFLLPLLLLLLTIVPFAVHAKTIRCTTELKRLCDRAEVCTTTSSIQPAVEYLIHVSDKPGTAKIVRRIGGKKVASWESDLIPSEGDPRHGYSVGNDSNRFTLSESFKTFSYRFATGKGGGEQNELGTCSIGAQ